MRDTKESILHDIEMLEQMAEGDREMQYTLLDRIEMLLQCDLPKWHNKYLEHYDNRIEITRQAILTIRKFQQQLKLYR